MVSDTSRTQQYQYVLLLRFCISDMLARWCTPGTSRSHQRHERQVSLSDFKKKSSVMKLFVGAGEVLCPLSSAILLVPWYAYACLAASHICI